MTFQVRTAVWLLLRRRLDGLCVHRTGVAAALPAPRNAEEDGAVAYAGCEENTEDEGQRRCISCSLYILRLIHVQLINPIIIYTRR